MKRKLFLPLMAMGSFLTLVSNNTDVLANTGYGGGSGTESDPYLISTPEHLNRLRLDVEVSGVDTTGKYYQLTNDIDLANFDTDNDSSNGNWDPIGSFDDDLAFSGVFDGNGYKIENMKIINQPMGGLFDNLLGAEIKRLELTNVEIQDTADTTMFAGALSGIANLATIQQVAVSGSVSAYMAAGGLVAGSNYSTISDCYSNVSMESVVHGPGGIAGVSGDGTITRCFAVGPMFHVDDQSGGIVGGVSTFEGPFVTNSYFDMETTNSTLTIDGSTGLTTAQMTGTAAKTNMVGLDFDNVWMTTDRYPVFKTKTEEVTTYERDLLVDGNIESAILSLTVPSNALTFVLNPNKEVGKQFITSDFELINQTQAPLSLELKNFEQVTDVLNDVESTKYTNWEGLNKTESKDIALALVPKVGDGWLVLNEGNRWVADLGETNIGTIKGNSAVSFDFEAKHGTSFTETLTPQYRLTFVFGLQD